MRLPALLATAAVLTMAACSSAPVSETPPGDPTQDPTVWGLEWTTIPGSGPIDEETRFEAFGAAGALWLYEAETPTVLHTTSDGASWTTWDLVEHGLPAEVDAVRGIGGIVLDDRGDAVTLVYGQHGTADHPAALLERMWLVDIADDDVTVRAGVDVGLETMPPAEGGWSFRTGNLQGFAHLDGSRYAIGDGQWWQPYKTSSYDAFAATETEAGWQVFSTNTPPLGGADSLVSPVAIATLGGSLVVLTESLLGAYPFEVWLSSDGIAWDSVAPTFEGAGADYGIVSVAVGASGLVAVGLEGSGSSAVPVAWASADGRQWTRSVLPGDGVVPTRVLATDAGFFVLGDGSDATAWTSPDGIDWTVVDAELPAAASDAVPVAGGLVAVTLWDLRVSGLDWG